ncbi:MAG: hypothetical protein B7Z81_01920 [Acidocella sp. 20-61-6]|nr:MAG: hypothetical protein B7Z81_01920 [Acidocella sp. 20-61-6]
MTSLPFALPDWMPGWVFLILALIGLLWLLAFLLMPFSVIGVKSRIEALEAEVASLREDLRLMGMRASGALPSVSRVESYDDVPNFGSLKRAQAKPAEPPELPARTRPPIITPEPRIPPAPPAGYAETKTSYGAPEPRFAPPPAASYAEPRSPFGGPARDRTPPAAPAPQPRPGRRTEPRLD